MSTSGVVVAFDQSAYRSAQLANGMAVAPATRDQVRPGPQGPDVTGFRSLLVYRSEPLVVISDAGQLLCSNGRAEALLSATASLRLRGQRLWMTHSDACLNGRHLERSAPWQAGTDQSPEHVRFEIPTRGEEPRLFCEALRVCLRGWSAWLLRLFRIGCPRRPKPCALRALLGLTPAEARLVAALYCQPALPAAAREIRISHETARAHLKHVFGKCEVSSQAELIRLVANGPFF